MPITTERADALVLFGVTGDLVSKKLLPALYHLACDKRLPDHVIGVARTAWDEVKLHDHARSAVLSDQPEPDEAAVTALAVAVVAQTSRERKLATLLVRQPRARIVNGGLPPAGVLLGSDLVSHSVQASLPAAGTDSPESGVAVHRPRRSGASENRFGASEHLIDIDHNEIVSSESLCSRRTQVCLACSITLVPRLRRPARHDQRARLVVRRTSSGRPSNHRDQNRLPR